MRTFIAAAALLALAACGQTTTVTDTPEEPKVETPATPEPMTAAEATAQDTCGASGYRAMVGSNVAAITLPAGLNHRIIAPNTPVTMDFNAERINFLTDANGVITSVECY
jgi:hypothetical protein